MRIFCRVNCPSGRCTKNKFRRRILFEGVSGAIHIRYQVFLSRNQMPTGIEFKF
jgi:hypothetical protein